MTERNARRFHKEIELLTQASFEQMLRLQMPASLDDRQRFFWRDRYGLTGHAGSFRRQLRSLSGASTTSSRP